MSMHIPEAEARKLAERDMEVYGQGFYRKRGDLAEYIPSKQVVVVLPPKATGECPPPVDAHEAAEREHLGCAHCKTGIYATQQQTGPLANVLDLIDRKAEAGLCQMTHAGARAFLNEIREIAKGAIAQQQAEPSVQRCTSCGGAKIPLRNDAMGACECEQQAEPGADDPWKLERQILAEIEACIADPMWADHVEVSKAGLKKWVRLIQHLMLAVQSGQRPESNRAYGAYGLYAKLKAIVEEATDLGYVVTVEQVPLQPLAMGHYHTTVTVRPARKKVAA
jgi:hypothetical protein